MLPTQRAIKDPPLTPDFYIGMIGGDSVFICGIDELEVPMVLAIDPNELEVEQICPIDAERYRVQMRMQVCNEGPGHIGKFTFRLIDHTGGKLGQPVFPESHDITFLPATSPTALPEWQFEWETYLDGVPLPGTNYDADEIHTCATARFVLTTDWLGVQALSEGGALELCVKFPNMPDTCSLSYGFKDFCREGGYRCEECPNNVHVCKTALCCKWIWVLVVLVVLVLLIQLWMLYTSKQPAKSKKVKKMKKE